MGIAAADQFAGDPAERIGMVAAVVAGRPVGLLCGDGGADRLLVGDIIQRQLEIDRGKARLFRQGLTHRDIAFPMRCELWPDIGDRFVIGEKTARHGDRSSHSGEPLGQRVDERDVVALPLLLSGFLPPSPLQVGDRPSPMNDRAGRTQRALRLDGGGKGVSDGFETRRNVAACAVSSERDFCRILNVHAVRLLHRQPP